MIKRIIITLLGIYLFFPVSAQNTGLSDIFNAESELKVKFSELQSSPHSPDDTLNQTIIRLFSEILQHPESFHYTWPQLDMIGIVQSDDQKIKVFTWNMANERGGHAYAGIIQQRIPQGRDADIIRLHVLKDNSAQIRNPESQTLSANNWLGALYYSIAEFSFRRQTYYVLLGFDFNNNFSNKKLIEILRFEDDELIFGENIKKGNDEPKRLIFEYSSEIVMTLRYDKKLDKIVFDHLTPLEPMLRGVYRFYVPDGSYDALNFHRGEFIFLEDVDARNF